MHPNGLVCMPCPRDVLSQAYHISPFVNFIRIRMKYFVLLFVYSNMRILDKIEVKMEEMIEILFKTRRFDPAQIEIELKRTIERNCRKDVLGEIMVNSSYTVEMSVKVYEKMSVFSDVFQRRLVHNIKAWLKEKNYYMNEALEIRFTTNNSIKRFFEVHPTEKSAGHLVVPDVVTGESKEVNAELRFIHGRGVFKINENNIIIGRDESCHLVLVDETVSKQHAIVTNRAGRVKIRDLGSKNGVWVNHQKVSKAILSDTDKVMIGNVGFVFRCGTGH